MSWKRLIHWTCDKCRKEAAKEGYGFPPGWSYIHPTLRNPIIEHRCDVCTEEEENARKAKTHQGSKKEA